MDPMSQLSPSILPFGGALFLPGVFATMDEENDYLASLDSDTRDYVIKHTSEFRTRGDVIDCVNKLHGES